jgi:hypothetical protein
MAAPFWEGTDPLLITINTYRVPYLESHISAPNIKIGHAKICSREEEKKVRMLPKGSTAIKIVVL